MNKTLLELDDFELEGDSSPKQKNVKKDPVLEHFLDIFSNYKTLPFNFKAIKYEQNHIQNFIDFYKDNKIDSKWDFGTFISLLINYVDDDEVTIDLTEFPFRFKNFGKDLEGKSVNIIGHVGDVFGNNAKNCTFNAVSCKEMAGYRAEHCVFNVDHFDRLAGLKCRFSEFNAKAFKEGAGANSFKSIFRAETFAEATGMSSENCLFYADEGFKGICPADINIKYLREMNFIGENDKNIPWNALELAFTYLKKSDDISRFFIKGKDITDIIYNIAIEQHLKKHHPYESSQAYETEILDEEFEKYLR